MSDDVHTLSGLYALDALDPTDRMRFEAHLRRCPACAQEVEELRSTSARLGAVAATAPPPELKAKVLAEVAVTRQERPVTPPAAARRRWLPRVATGAAAAVIVLALGLLTWRVTDTNRELDRADAVNAVLTAADATNRQLEGTSGIQAHVVGSDRLGRTVVVLDGLDPVPEDQRYALWLIDAEGPKPMGLVLPDSDQRAVVLLDTGLEGFDAFGLTVEPATGSPVPTGDLLVQGELT